MMILDERVYFTSLSFARNRLVIEAEAEAEAVALRGEAEAYAIEVKAKAEAEQMNKKAEAFKEYKEAALVEMMLKVGILKSNIYLFCTLTF